MNAMSPRPAKPQRALRRTAVGLAVAAAATVALPSPFSLARPAGQHGPIIAYERHSAAGADIVLMRFDGMYPVNATNDARFDGQPAWAPPYNAVVDQQGPGGCRLPVSQDLAFSRADAAGQLDIYRIEVTSPNSFPAVGIGSPVRLTTNPAADTAPAWSPGPQSQSSSLDSFPAKPLLAFVRESGDRDIYAMDPDQPGTETLLTPDWPGHEGNPDWSPIVTSDNRDDPTSVQHFAIAFDSDRSGTTQIWTLDVTYQPGRNPAFIAGEARQVTSGPEPHANPSWFVFTDDTRGLVYTTVHGGTQYLDLVVAGQFSSFLPLTGDPGGDDAPEWSPFGDEILFSRATGGGADIGVINPYPGPQPDTPNLERQPALEGGIVRMLTSEAGAELNPTRQPNERSCASAEPNAPIPRTPSRTARPSGEGGGGTGSGSSGGGGGGSGGGSGQRGESRRALSATIASVSVVKRGRRRTLVVRLRVNTGVSVRARLYRGRRQVTSRLFHRRRAGTHTLYLRVPSRARPGRHVLRLTVRPTSGAPKRLARSVRLRR
jgi:uncharacterized membrane protein YgcG